MNFITLYDNGNDTIVQFQQHGDVVFLYDNRGEEKIGEMQPEVITIEDGEEYGYWSDVIHYVDGKFLPDFHTIRAAAAGLGYSGDDLEALTAYWRGHSNGARWAAQRWHAAKSYCAQEVFDLRLWRKGAVLLSRFPLKFSELSQHSSGRMSLYVPGEEYTLATWDAESMQELELLLFESDAFSSGGVFVDTRTAQKEIKVGPAYIAVAMMLNLRGLYAPEPREEEEETLVIRW